MYCTCVFENSSIRYYRLITRIRSNFLLFKANKTTHFSAKVVCFLPQICPFVNFSPTDTCDCKGFMTEKQNWHRCNCIWYYLIFKYGACRNSNWCVSHDHLQYFLVFSYKNRCSVHFDHGVVSSQVGWQCCH